SIKHERASWSSTSTVHAPQTPCSQPTCVPVSRSSCLRKSLNSNRGSTVRWYVRPLTVTLMGRRSGISTQCLQRAPHVEGCGYCGQRAFAGAADRPLGQYARQVCAVLL